MRLLALCPLLVLTTTALCSCATPSLPAPRGAPPPPSGRQGASGRGGGTTRTIPEVPLGEAFALPFDTLVRVAGAGTRLRFSAVLEDSRCPPRVECAEAGRAIVRIDVAPAQGTPAELELHSDSDRRRGAAGGLELEMVKLDPPTQVDHRAPPQDYVLTLTAHRASTP